MFKKPFRDKLRKHGWLAAAQEGGNESQSWRRTQENVKLAISDMILLSQTLPQDKIDELFNIRNFHKLINILIYSKEIRNLTKLDVMHYLVSRSISEFQMIYGSQNENTPALTSAINDYLEKAVDICSDITYRERLNDIKHNIPEKGLLYLGSWFELGDREKNNLRSFISSMPIPIVIGENLNLDMSFEDDEISGQGIDLNSQEPFNIKLTLNETLDKADLLISNAKGVIATYSFIVKSNIYGYLLYYRESDIIKK